MSGTQVFCECVDWETQIRIVNAPIVLQSARSGGEYSYTGKLFSYCPWCGTKLAQREVEVPYYDSEQAKKPVPPDFTEVHGVEGVGEVLQRKMQTRIAEVIGHFKTLGVTHCRASCSQDGHRVWIEGWRVQPELETAPPLGAGL